MSSSILAPHASSLVVWGITGLSLALMVAWTALLWRTSARSTRARDAISFALGALAWAGLTFGLAAAGVFARIDARPPPFVLVLGGVLVLGAGVAASPIGARLASTPLWLLVGLQSFRLPLELVMHRAALESTMPPQMSFGVVHGIAGCNYDIVTGATALIVSALLRAGRASRALVRTWNIVGLALLAIIVVVGVTSTPVFALFGHEPARLNTWMLFAPFVWLPAILVTSALLGHLVILRALRRSS